jgi:Mg2+ and Co2+ transporter CorA
MNDLSQFRSAAAAQVEPQIVWAFEFDSSGRGRPLSGLPDLKAARAGFVWLHLDLIHVSTRRWLDDSEDTLGASVDSLNAPDAHPHVDWSSALLWGVVRDVYREIEGAAEHSAELRFVLSPRFLITGRRRPMQSSHALKRKVETGGEYESSAELFEALLTEIAEAIGRVSSRTAERLEEVEDRVLAVTVSDERANLLALRREVARYARLATSLRAVVGRLDQVSGAALPPNCRNLTARLAQRAASLHADIHFLSDHARMLTDEVSAQVSEEANRNLFTLSILTALLLPPSLVTGFFGMNTKNLPFADTEFGTLFAFAVGAGAALCVYLLMRRSRILGRDRA